MMSGSTEGDAISNIDDVGEKLKNVCLHDGCDDNDDDDNSNHNDEANPNSNSNSNSEHEHSALSQCNYTDEMPHQMNQMNHLFHIDFMRSMQNLRSQDKRSAGIMRFIIPTEKF